MIVCPNAAAESPLVSNVFDNTFLIDALRDISNQCGVSIIADSTVQGQVTMAFDNVPLEETLFRLLIPGGYIFKDMGGYYLVGAPDSKNPAFPILSKTEMIKLSYAKAESAASLLADSFKSYIKVDNDSNSLVVTAPDTILSRIKSDLTCIDRPLSQLIIEAMIVELTQDGRKDLGTDWRWDHALTNKASDSGVGLSSSVIQLAGLAMGIDYIPASGLNRFLTSIKAVVTKGNARVQANPRVTALDGQTAEIFIGRDRYYGFNTGTENDPNTRLESIKTGISLKLAPRVADNGDITLKIEPEVSDVISDSSNNSSFPVVNLRKVSTTVRVKTGDSIVLGGLVQKVSTNVESKVPILGYIPFIGALFTANNTVEEDREVLIIITCSTMDDGNTGKEAKLKDTELL